MSQSRFIAALVPPSMRAELERSAAANERTLSGEIRLALRQHLHQDPGASIRPEEPAARREASSGRVGSRPRAGAESA
jgi:hypothetical protein